MGHRPQDSQPRHDLDSTDELPILDESLAAASEDRLSTTGEWPPLADADAAGGDLLSTTGEFPALEAHAEGATTPSEDAIAAFTSTLREKSFAIARLERELEAARAAAQRQVRATPAEVAILEQRLAEVERQRLALAARHDDRRARLAAAEEALAVERTRQAAVQATVHARLAEREAALLEAETKLAAESMRAEALQAEVERLRVELDARGQAEAAARLKLERERRESDAAESTSAGAGQSDLARERDHWRAREEERSAELRRVREELREARLHVERLLEQLRSREALGRYDEDFQAAGATPQVPAADPRPAEAAPVSPEPVPAAPRAVAPANAGRSAVLPKRYLVRLDDPVAPLQVLGQERIRVGRTPENDLRLDEDWISRHHATLRLGPDSTVVEDAGSTNGVFVNGRRVRREVLRDGDVLAFGKARFRFQVHRPGGARD